MTPRVKIFRLEHWTSKEFCQSTVLETYCDCNMQLNELLNVHFV